MAAFTHARVSRFGDGSYGVYYAALHRETAINETVHHVETFYRSTNEVSADIDMRVYAATVAGSFEELLTAKPSDPRLDPDSYAAAHVSARKGYDEDGVDGIVYPSVRDPQHGDCLACFRARSISACHTHGYLTYRWDGVRGRIVDVFERESFRGL